MGCGAETEANTLLNDLTAGLSWPVHEVDLDDPKFAIPETGDLGLPVSTLSNSDLTTGEIEGTGTFDALMKGLRAHLQNEFDKGRITGEQYARAHIELTNGAMGNAVQFLLGRDAAYWNAVTAQLQAQAAQAAVVTARLQAETAKVQFMALRYEALTHQANFALTKMKLATESVGYCVAKFNLEEMLPAQKQLVMEQTEAQHAQTSDTKMDGVTPVTGQVGKQKELYAQQITSYQRDAESKAAKLFTDAWITMKTIDEGLLPPTAFNNASVDEVLNKVKENNDLKAGV